MYIRTQDREKLIPINNLTIALESEQRMIYSNNIVAYSNNNNNYYILGFYKTKDRAIEILDDIQKTLQCCFSCNVSSSSKIPNYKDGIYVMPEE